jgi:hypothetical protein
MAIILDSIGRRTLFLTEIDQKAPICSVNVMRIALNETHLTTP